MTIDQAYKRIIEAAYEVDWWQQKLMAPGGLNPPGYCPPLERLRAAIRSLKAAKEAELAPPIKLKVYELRPVGESSRAPEGSTKMSDLQRIANMDTCLSEKVARAGLADGCKGFHESVLRSYNILAKVKGLLELGTPREVVLELISLMESDEFQPYAWHENRYHEQSGHDGVLVDCTKCRPERKP